MVHRGCWFRSIATTISLINNMNVNQCQTKLTTDVDVDNAAWGWQPMWVCLMTYKVDDWCGCWLTSCRSIAVWRPQALEHTCMACCGQVLCNTQQQAMKYKRQNSVSGISWDLSEQNLHKSGISANRIFKSNSQCCSISNGSGPALLLPPHSPNRENLVGEDTR